MYDADKDAYDLEQAAKSTGIYDIVDSKRYYALSPSWYIDPENTHPVGRTTKHPVIFWLNPTDQQHNSYGYFTVEQLTAWINGEAADGPIAGRGTLYARKKRAGKIADGEVDNLHSDEVFCKPCLNIININRQPYGTSIIRCDVCGDLIKRRTKTAT